MHQKIVGKKSLIYVLKFEKMEDIQYEIVDILQF